LFVSFLVSFLFLIITTDSLSPSSFRAWYIYGLQLSMYYSTFLVSWYGLFRTSYVSMTVCLIMYSIYTSGESFSSDRRDELIYIHLFLQLGLPLAHLSLCACVVPPLTVPSVYIGTTIKPSNPSHRQTSPSPLIQLDSSKHGRSLFAHRMSSSGVEELHRSCQTVSNGGTGKNLSD
jgi:hypothetical protein